MRRRPPSPVVNVRSAERRFLDEFLVMLADGFKMRKHGRRGGPKDRLVRLDGDMIVWTAVRPSFRLSERGGVAVDAPAAATWCCERERACFACACARRLEEP